jgi:hypothetical protein
MPHAMVDPCPQIPPWPLQPPVHPCGCAVVRCLASRSELHSCSARAPRLPLRCPLTHPRLQRPGHTPASPPPPRSSNPHAAADARASAPLHPHPRHGQDLQPTRGCRSTRIGHGRERGKRSHQISDTNPRSYKSPRSASLRLGVPSPEHDRVQETHDCYNSYAAFLFDSMRRGPPPSCSPPTAWI